MANKTRTGRARPSARGVATGNGGGLPLSMGQARSLVEGVVAAPEGHDPEAWMRLVAPRPSRNLKSVLKRLYDEASARQSSEPDAAERLTLLRRELARRRLDGFIVPRADEHQGEYVPARAMRLAWLTGFSGSAGLAIVLRDKAAMFVDGRYTLQVRGQVDGRLFDYRHITDQPATAWIADSLRPGGRLGYDPWLHTESHVAILAAACKRAGGRLVACADNPLDAVWTAQPPQPLSPVVPHPQRYAGRTSARKRMEAAESLLEAKADGAVISAPDSIAWLLNVRGGDVPCTPLPLSFAVLHADASVDWFVDSRKLAPGLDRHLGNAVRVRAPSDLGPVIDRLGKAAKMLRMDPHAAPAWLGQRARKAGARIDRGPDPCQMPKACKNAVELKGTRTAHRRDGAALTRFLHWLSATASQGGLTELTAAERLRAFRAEDKLFRGPSFSTISGAGPNGAIVHYRVTEETNRGIDKGSLYLVDSGGQYLDGTTDVTRTIAIGKPTAEMRQRFTRVLKGHIAIATARFPKGTTGSQLDALARMALWQAGLDFDHGTGHGVGSYLAVHEGPQRIAKGSSGVALRPGMILSNEPGYYKTGAYGMRMENLEIVVPANIDGEGGREFYAFEALTIAPVDLTLVEPGLMTAEELQWLDAYHARVRKTLTPLLDKATARWLKAATAPVGARR